MSAPVFVMGSATNDNVVTCVTFLMISLQFALLEKPTTRTIWYSALEFALCCGIKPQYVTLAPLWALWFFFAKPTPAKHFKLISLVILIPLAVICSPLPTLGLNYFKNGSLVTPACLDADTPQDNASATEPEVTAEVKSPIDANAKITDGADHPDAALPVNLDKSPGYAHCRSASIINISISTVSASFPW